MSLLRMLFSGAKFSRSLLMPKTFGTGYFINKTVVVPVAGIFLFLWKSVFRPKSLRHTETAYWAPKNNFLTTGAKGSEDRETNILAL